jgi:hypothetical protein
LQGLESLAFGGDGPSNRSRTQNKMKEDPVAQAHLDLVWHLGCKFLPKAALSLGGLNMNM